MAAEMPVMRIAMQPEKGSNNQPFKPSAAGIKIVKKSAARRYPTLASFGIASMQTYEVRKAARV
jgi:hypothetical protein